MTGQIQYASFGDRFGAYLLDVIFIALPTFGLNYLNFTMTRSFYIYILIALVALLYKPFMESKYQATFGKMALNLKVTDVDFKQISFEKSLLRSLIYMLPAFVSIPVEFLAYNNANLMAIESFWEYSQAVNATYSISGLFSCFFSLIFLTDLIMLLTDETYNRSLKDRLAKTYVMKQG